MASEETIRKMVHAIIEKRRKLGIPDWGMVPVEEVLNRLDQTSNDDEEQPSTQVQQEQSPIVPE